MTAWTLALAYVVAAAMALGALARSRDRRVLVRLSPVLPASRGGPRVVREGSGRKTPGDPADLIELVALMVGAGLSPRLAVERATVAIRGSSSAKLREVVDAARLGAPWGEAIRVAGVGKESQDLVSLIRILDRGQRLGVPVTEGLRSLAAQVRERRRMRLEERARRAPVLMLFPLVLCILPAFVVAAVLPAVLVAARGFA